MLSKCPMPKFSGKISGKYHFVAFNPPDSRIYGSLGSIDPAIFAYIN